MAILFDGPPPAWVKYSAEPLCVGRGWQAEWVAIALSGAAYLMFFTLAAACALHARLKDMQGQWVGDRALFDEDTQTDRLLLEDEDEEHPRHERRFGSTARLFPAGPPNGHKRATTTRAFFSSCGCSISQSADWWRWHWPPPCC